MQAQPLEIRYDMEPLVAQLTAELPGHAGQRRLIPVRRLVGKVVETVEAALEFNDAAGEREDLRHAMHLIAASGHQNPVALGRNGPRILDRSAGPHRLRTVAHIPALHGDMPGNLVFAVSESQAAMEGRGPEENHPDHMPANVWR